MCMLSPIYHRLQTVLEILGLWQDLQFATQQRYLETQDHDGENAFQLAVREREGK